jgi:hypothetical protein
MLKGQDTADASAGCESTARIACEVNGEVRPSAAGTHRNGRSAAIVGIPFLQGAGGCQGSGCVTAHSENDGFLVTFLRCLIVPHWLFSLKLRPEYNQAVLRHDMRGL